MQHSEGNHSTTESMRFIQMWIIPSRVGLEPSVEQASFDEASRRGRFRPVLVPADGYGGPDAPSDPDAVHVHQDAAVYAALIAPGEALTHRFREGFWGYVFVRARRRRPVREDPAATSTRVAPRRSRTSPRSRSAPASSERRRSSWRPASTAPVAREVSGRDDRSSRSTCLDREQRAPSTT